MKVEITDSTRQDLIRLGRSFGFSMSIVEDCVQDTLIKIWKNVEYFDGEKGKFFTWAGVILYRTIIDSIKRKKKVIIDCDLSEVYWINPQINQIESQIEIDHIEYYFNQIKSQFRKPMLLRRSGYRYDEIGRILNRSEGTIKAQIFRGRVKLLELINN